MRGVKTFLVKLRAALDLAKALGLVSDFSIERRVPNAVGLDSLVEAIGVAGVFPVDLIGVFILEFFGKYFIVLPISVIYLQKPRKANALTD